MQRFTRETGLRYSRPALWCARAWEFQTMSYARSMRLNLAVAKTSRWLDAIETYRADAKHWLDLSRALRRGEAVPADLD
jgi:hypothetical protein